MLRKDMMKNMEQEKKAKMSITKSEVRKKVREQKRAMTTEEVHNRSQVVLERFYQSEEFRDAECIYTYVNYNQEIETKLLIEYCLQLGKRIFVPRVDGEWMDFYEIHSLTDLEPGAYNIPEPKSYCVKSEHPCGLMVMPGLAFDYKGHRIGYGGGFYDRYIARFPEFKKVALGFDFQLFEELNTEDFDIPVQVVITESERIEIEWN